jgi:AbrB family looped-hinge helix DNA binding protein
MSRDHFLARRGAQRGGRGLAHGEAVDITARLTSKARAVLPKEVRKKLGVEPGDTIRFRETEQGILLEKAELHRRGDDWADPFASFTEWASPEEDEAWKNL